MAQSTPGSSGIRAVGGRLDNWMYPYRGGGHPHPGRAIAPQIAILAMALIAYFAVRGMTKGAETVAIQHARDLLDLEATLGLDWEYGVQQWAIERPTLIRAANATYVWGYWPPLLGALAFFWVKDRREYTVLRDALILSGAAGLVVFASYPVAPPRFLDGFVDTIAESRRGMFIAQPPGFVNKFAALPSFHTGWLALAGAMVAPHLRGRWANLAWAPFAAMAVAVVLTGNHFVVDIVAGVACSMAGLAASRRIHRVEAAAVLPLVLDHGTMRFSRRPQQPIQQDL